MKTEEQLTKINKALAAYKRARSIYQPKVEKKILGHAAMGRTFVALHACSSASAVKLRKVGFEVTPGPNKPPHSIKWVVRWGHMFV
jgi:predicted PP-loop superfamily ATPase